METNQITEKISALGKEWRGAQNGAKKEISKQISAFLLEADEKKLTALLPGIRSLSWLTDKCLDYVLAHIYSPEEIKKIFPLSKRRSGQRQKLAQRYGKLLEASFQSALFKEKVAIFKDANHEGDTEIDQENKKFCQRHWQNFIYSINNPEKGLLIYNAFVGNSPTCPEIWATVAAIKTVKVWGQQNSVEQIDTGQAAILQKLNLSLQPGKILVAQEILKKMGQ
ncbi:MAG: hypothetical protein PHG95_04395 [Patescibacteria group bacterium]|nr:hypothetical protein [Patescibacteria group bacterium]